MTTQLPRGPTSEDDEPSPEWFEKAKKMALLAVRLLAGAIIKDEFPDWFEAIQNSFDND